MAKSIINRGISLFSFPLFFLMTEAIPISKAPVSVITPRKPPIYKKNLKTEFEMSIIILRGVIKKYSK